MLGRIDVPQFLDADAVNLRLAIGFQIELGLERLGQVAARAFSEEGVLGVEFHAGLVFTLVAAILGYAHVLGGDALDRAIFVVEHLRGREAGEDLDAQLFGLAGQPAAQIAERPGVIAVVRHERGHRPVRHVELASGGEHPVPVVGHRRFSHRAAVFAPVRQQLVQCLGIDHRARQDVRADFRTLFQDADRKLCIHLFQPDRRSKAGRAAADDNDVIGHGFAFAHGPPVRG